MRRQPIPPQETPEVQQATKNIHTYYDEVIGPYGLQEFNAKVLAQAIHSLAARPDLLVAYTNALIDSASYVTTPNVSLLWTPNIITPQTFGFAKALPQLLEPSKQKSKKYVFHIGDPDYLTRLPNQTLLPPYLLNDAPFQRDMNPNDRYIYFANDNVDNLAQFLAGHQQLTMYVSANHALADSETCGLLAPEDMMIAAVEKNKVELTKTLHGNDTLYRMDATNMPHELSKSIFLAYADHPVEVDHLISVPATALPRNIRDTIESEAREFYREYVERGRVQLEFPVSTKQQFIDLYRMGRHMELAIKYALLTHENGSWS